MNDLAAAARIAPDPWALLLCVSALLLLLGAVSGLVNARSWVSEPLLCVLAGVSLGPFGAGLLRLDPGAHPIDAAVLREFARVTLAIAVTSAATRLPKGWMRAHRREMAVALGPGMLLMWAVGSLAALGILGLPPLLALLVGAAITPTDPVLSVPVVTGALARHAVPEDLRHAITAESAANDGLASPIVMVPILLLTTSTGLAASRWALDVVAWQLGTAVVVGCATGWLAGRCHGWASAQPHADEASLLTVSVVLSVVTLSALQVLGGNAIVAAFVSGIVFKEALADRDVTKNEHFTEALSRFFDLPVMVLFGASVPWAAWLILGWRGCAFVAVVLLFRRVSGLGSAAALAAADGRALAGAVRGLVRPDRSRCVVLCMRRAGEDRLGRALAGGEPGRRGVGAGPRRDRNAPVGVARPAARQGSGRERDDTGSLTRSRSQPERRCGGRPNDRIAQADG